MVLSTLRRLVINNYTLGDWWELGYKHGYSEGFNKIKIPYDTSQLNAYELKYYKDGYKTGLAQGKCDS